jgi:Holliday junction resolvase
MTPEKKVRKKVEQLLDLYGVYYFAPMSGGFTKAGVPDLVCCYKSKFIGIECKAGTNKPTELQKRELNRIQKAGGFAMVVNEEAIHLVEDVLKFIDGELK